MAKKKKSATTGALYPKKAGTTVNNIDFIVSIFHNLGEFMNIMYGS